MASASGTSGVRSGSATDRCAWMSCRSVQNVGAPARTRWASPDLQLFDDPATGLTGRDPGGVGAGLYFGTVKALIQHARQLPGELYQSLTWDRGLEMADHKRFTQATNVAVYFCDPQSPWQRGSNENTNGLLRRYFPNGADLSVHSQQHLDEIARKLNRRPRKTLGYETPAQRFNASVALTG